MTRRDTFQRYARERRAAVLPGYRTEVVSGVTRFTPIAPDREGLVMFAELTASSAEDTISAQADYFSRLGLPFEWKVYDFDTPADLATRLDARRFMRGDTEAFMVYRTERHDPGESCANIRIERITTTAGIQQVVAIQKETWGGASPPSLAASLLRSLDRSAIYCAYHDDVPVGTGWVEFPERGVFAELHGGAVLPGLRGRGIYSALFYARVAEARRRGFEFLAVDAAPMSRPILRRKGFTPVCNTAPFRMG